MASPAALRELQRDLETRANDLSKIQKGNILIHTYLSLQLTLSLLEFPPFSVMHAFIRMVYVCWGAWLLLFFKIGALNVIYIFRYCEESPSEKEVHYPARWEWARPQGF